MADQKPKIQKIPGLRVRALVDGFRRGGRAWTAEAQDVAAASEFTKAQIAALKDEARLVVTDIEIEVPAE
jgi:hypothetical protein